MRAIGCWGAESLPKSCDVLGGGSPREHARLASPGRHRGYVERRAWTCSRPVRRRRSAVVRGLEQGTRGWLTVSSHNHAGLRLGNERDVVRVISHVVRVISDVVRVISHVVPSHLGRRAESSRTSCKVISDVVRSHLGRRVSHLGRRASHPRTPSGHHLARRVRRSSRTSYESSRTSYESSRTSCETSSRTSCRVISDVV